MNKRIALKTVAASVLLTLGLGLLGACTESKPQFHGVDITGADYAKDFRLADHNGQVRSLQDFKGKAVIVFFGYTQCPDVCPTSMAELAEVKKLLGADGDKLQGIFVTVDPERDTREVMAEYISAFDPRFTGLTGTREQVDGIIAAYRVYARKVDREKGPYLMDHTATVYLLDKDGKFTGTLDYHEATDTALAKLKRLIGTS